MERSDKQDDQQRLAELVMLLGAVASDVVYDRVTFDALQANLHRMQGKVTTWLEDVKKRPRS